MGLHSDGTDASFVLKAPGTVQSDPGTTWTYYKVGGGFVLHVLGPTVLNSLIRNDSSGFGADGSKITGFTLSTN